MPQTASAKKALRSSERKRVVNNRWRNILRVSVRAVQDALQAGDAKSAAQNYSKAQSIIDRAARHNVIHPRQAARKKSRLKQAIQKASS
jgi:small subunit ribosomal protein S20